LAYVQVRTAQHRTGKQSHLQQRTVTHTDDGRTRVNAIVTDRDVLYWIPVFQRQPEPDRAGFRNSNPAGIGATFEQNLFLDQTIIDWMRPMISSILIVQFSASCVVTVRQLLMELVR